MTPEDRQAVVAELKDLRLRFKKIDLPPSVLDGYQHPPASPQVFIFAQTTTTVSADLNTRITPCQFGGRPVCTECGCMASAGLASGGRYKAAGLLKVSSLLSASMRLGEFFAPQNVLEDIPASTVT